MVFEFSDFRMTPPQYEMPRLWPMPFGNCGSFNHPSFQPTVTTATTAVCTNHQFQPMGFEFEYRLGYPAHVLDAVPF